MEREILDFWEKKEVFQLLLEKNREGPIYSFIDGPITANNPMGVHHAWGRTYKDLYLRYKSMQGFRMRYQNGFDCQGLWVEVEVEKELGFNSKRQIEEFGLDNFSLACKERARRFADLITQQSKRLGMWMDWDHSYYTMDDNNIEHIWYFLKRCHENGWLYQGHRSMPWCIRCGTSLSQHEILGSDSYEELTHDAVFIQLPIHDRESEYFLVWTTTPWTLSANVALAVHPDLDYALVESEGRIYILSLGLKDKLLPAGKIKSVLKGKKLLGLRYSGPFDELPAQKNISHIVIPWEEVSETEGTGIVHIAPGCGAEDFELSRIHSLPVLVPLDEYGTYLDGYGFLTGKNVKEVNLEIFQSLKEKDYFFRVEEFTHRYPVCWRCHEELVFRVEEEWFISTDQVRPALIREASRVHWYPETAGKRMRNWLANMGDWCISRKRYWGLPLPFYRCQSCGELTVIGSLAELEELNADKPLRIPELHRPWVDEIKIRCPRCSGLAHRILEVGDCWLDAGIVPYSTLHYLHDSDYWKTWFPAEFITEMREQIRLWFYSMLFMSVTLEDRTPYLQALVYEKLLDEKGHPMHRSLGNAIWFDEAVEKMGADVMRWLYAGQNIESNILFGYGPAEEVTRKLLLLWNVYAFFVTYANIDNFNPAFYSSPLEKRSFIDRWILSRLHTLVKEAAEHLDGYDVAYLVEETEKFVEDLSTWWLRRSRRRFWKSEEDGDKINAYLTLYEALLTLSRILAPIIPFLTEDFYRNLACSIDPDAPLSVHLTPYPQAKREYIRPDLEEKMCLIKKLIGLGRAVRNKAGIKVRQPLSHLILVGLNKQEKTLVKDLAELILEELNLKGLQFERNAHGLQEIVVLPNLPLLGPKYGRDLPLIRERLKGLGGEKIIESLESEGRITIQLSGGPVDLSAEELIVQRRDQPGYATEAEGPHLVVLDTVITPELRKEGLAREIVHNIQLLRKEAGFKVEDRISTHYEAEPELQEVFREFSPYIEKETLSGELRAGIPADCPSHSLKIEEMGLRLALRLLT